MRITKEYDERRTEIMNAAEKLFHTKGYNSCTITDILKEVGIAKGTFYYYFASKEEVMDAIVEQYSDLIATRARNVATKKEISIEERLIGVFISLSIKSEVSEEMMEEIHRSENALLHQKTLSQAINMLTPILVELIEEGNRSGSWNCQYPESYMQIFLAAAMTLTDDGMFEQSEESQQKIMVGLMSIMDKMLGLPENCCMTMFLKYMGGQQESENKEREE